MILMIIIIQLWPDIQIALESENCPIDTGIRHLNSDRNVDRIFLLDQRLDTRGITN